MVGLDLRALSDDGLLLYATDNETHPTQFFSLELVRGLLVYKFDSGRGLVSISTTSKYSGNGYWYRVGICCVATLHMSHVKERSITEEIFWSMKNFVYFPFSFSTRR